MEFTRFLVEHGADLIAQDENGWTPLHVASKYRRVEITRFPVEHGANAAAQDKEGSTPLQLASFSLGDLYEFLELENEHKNMKDAGFEVDERELRQEVASLCGNVKVSRVLVEHGADVGAQKKAGTTPSHLASRYGAVGVARPLLEHGADFTTEDNEA